MLVPRHGGHDHFANVQYDYIVLFLSILTMILVTVGNTFSRRFRRISGFDISLPIWLVAILWVLTISLLLFFNKPEHLNSFAKRAGRITFALIPLSLFLAMRPSPLPNTFYLRLLFLHKWVSRTIAVIGGVHGLCYIAYFIKKSEISKIFKVLNFLGVVALTIMALMTITSLGPLRKRYYRWFYLIHYPSSWAVILLGCIHARPGVSLLTFWCLFILVSQVFYRIFTSYHTGLTKSDQISSSLQLITLERLALPEHYSVGSHIRLSKKLWSPLAWIEPTHPYTIASLPSDSEVKLLVRKTRFDLSMREGASYAVMGPFPSVDPRVFEAPRVIVFAGGSGLSMAAPIIRQLTLLGKESKLVWIVKDIKDTNAIEFLEVAYAEIYVTGNGQNEKSYNDTASHTVPVRDDSGVINERESEEGIEFEELLRDDDSEEQVDDEAKNSDDRHSSDKLEEFEDGEKNDIDIGKDIKIKYGRPDFDRVSEEFLAKSAGSWVVACGPDRLVKDLNRWARSKDLKFSGESYSI